MAGSNRNGLCVMKRKKAVVETKPGVWEDEHKPLRSTAKCRIKFRGIVTKYLSERTVWVKLVNSLLHCSALRSAAQPNRIDEGRSRKRAGTWRGVWGAREGTGCDFNVRGAGESPSQRPREQPCSLLRRASFFIMSS